MTLFTENYFNELFDFSQLDRTVSSTVRLAAKNPTSFYKFLQRYCYFNGYASSVIARLASSIAMSRYLFMDRNTFDTEQADRGFQISAEVMVAASDEGAYEITHRELAQLLLKTAGDYAQLSTGERNQMATIPTWLEEIVRETMDKYQGTPGNAESLIKAMGFHAASELLGDREYALIDMIIRHENKGIGFDRYLRNETSATRIREGGHRYDPWCYVVIHGKYEGTGAEARHFIHVLNALNMIAPNRPESEEQINEWILEGFKSFVELQQSLFRKIYQECLEVSHQTQKADLILA
ncbi:hypothetical protein [Myxosarcina sp. GI1]|uniref:hypothetical protein n=1 Tax=Myxosarcina sp. GI1 TaxID=1541065 RepID=UPI00056388BB|nr:hypothetical protein [Myxosarcina sp. GI1]